MCGIKFPTENIYEKQVEFFHTSLYKYAFFCTCELSIIFINGETLLFLIDFFVIFFQLFYHI